MNKPKIAYGWFVVAACFIFEFIALGLGNATSSLYVKPICDDLNFNRSAYTLVFSIISIVNMVSCLTLGSIIKKVGVRLVFLIGIISQAMAFTAYYLAPNIYIFYIGAVFMGIALMFLGTIPLSLVVSNWFVHRRGTALGIVLAGSGIGGTILNPLTGNWIAAFGWRTAYLFSLLLVLVFAVPALLLIREKPADMGLKPFGEMAIDDPRKSQAPIHEAGLHFKEALKKSYFWLILAAALLFGMSIQPVFLSASARLADVGLEPKIIALAMSMVFFFNLLGKIFLGYISDRFGIKPLILISHLSFIAATAILIMTRGNTLAFVFAMFFGIAAVALILPIPLLTTNLFGHQDYSTFLGLIMATYTVGVSIGTPINGMSYDLFHSYTYAYIVQIILDMIAIGCILGALKLKANELKKGSVL